MNDLTGRTIVVVGAGAVGEGWGNGKACAVTYARAGATVVCVDHRLERAEETCDLITAEGGTAVAMDADATQEAGMIAVVERTRREFGRLDVMHNNVGVGGTVGGPHEITPAQWEREISQNLTTAYLGIRCAVPAMQEQGGGVITNISSTLAVRFFRRPSAAYSASKAAVEALTRSCAAAYGRDNIRVNCIRIGISETPLITRPLEAAGLSQEQVAAQMERSRSKVPLRGEHGDAFDVAEAARFLASDQAKYVSGVILNVDGALECAPV
jgi:NAD(P)-dependent dehydrogenase (short-subunit alcohol dehydrogenase family)